MWALIAFICLGVVVAALIEINERIKAKRPKADCPQEKMVNEDCSACELAAVCDKDDKQKAQKQTKK